jgi:hypothetical protein
MNRAPTHYETTCLNLLIESTKDFGVEAKFPSEWAGRIISSHTVSEDDEDFVDMVKTNIEMSDMQSVVYTSIPTVPSYIDSSLVNLHNFCKDNSSKPKEEQLGLYSQVIKMAWKKYAEVNGLFLEKPFNGFGQYSKSYKAVVGIDTKVVSPSLLLSFLRWFCDEFCEDSSIAMRFDIVLKRSFDGEMLVELLLDAGFHGFIQIVDEFNPVKTRMLQFLRS